MNINDILKLAQEISSEYENVLSIKVNVAGFEFSFLNDEKEFCTFIYSIENDIIVKKLYVKNELSFIKKERIVLS